MLRQRTLKTKISTTGVGLHTGHKVDMTLRPAAPDTGIVFHRTDLPGAADLPALAHGVTDTRLATCLGEGENKVAGAGAEAGAAAAQPKAKSVGAAQLKGNAGKGGGAAPAAAALRAGAGEGAGAGASAGAGAGAGAGKGMGKGHLAMIAPLLAQRDLELAKCAFIDLAPPPSPFTLCLPPLTLSAHPFRALLPPLFSTRPAPIPPTLCSSRCNYCCKEKDCQHQGRRGHCQKPRHAPPEGGGQPR
jgi:hypothetical protein